MIFFIKFYNLPYDSCISLCSTIFVIIFSSGIMILWSLFKFLCWFLTDFNINYFLSVEYKASHFLASKWLDYFPLFCFITDLLKFCSINSAYVLYLRFLWKVDKSPCKSARVSACVNNSNQKYPESRKILEKRKLHWSAHACMFTHRYQVCLVIFSLNI